MSYLTNQILRGAETIRRNSSESNKNTDSGFNKNMTTETPRIDSGYSQPAPDCPLCQNNTMVWETTHGWKCNRAGCHTIQMTTNTPRLDGKTDHYFHQHYYSKVV